MSKIDDIGHYFLFDMTIFEKSENFAKKSIDK